MEEVRDYDELEQALSLCKTYLDKEYLENIENYEIVNIEYQSSNIRIVKLKKFVYNDKENNIEKLTSVLTSINNINATFAYIIDSSYGEINIYIAIKTKDKTSLGKDILLNGLKGNFPGIELENIYNDEIEELFDRKIFDSSKKSIASSVVIPKRKNDKLDFDIQGIEKFIDSMLAEEYTAIFLAKSLSSSNLLEVKTELENIFTLISPFKETTFSFNESESENISKTISNGITEGISKTITNTHGTTKSVNASIGLSLGTTIGISAGGKLGILSGGISKSLARGIHGSISGGTAKTNSKSESDTTQNSTTSTEADTTGSTIGEGRNYTFKSENKTRIQLLNKLDFTLKRIQESEDLGMYSFGAYFIAHTDDIALRLASTYAGLVRGENSGLEKNHINIWNNDKVNLIKTHLSKLEHILLKDENELKITPTTLVTSRELSIGTGFPYKSIPGINVMNFTPFARNICTYNNKEYDKKIKLGQVFHMGTKEDRDVNLSLKDLTMHTFITGSTGSGKTNTTCKIIEEVVKKGVKVLVIEPAKGEYKYELDSNKFKVYGTNPYISNLIKINPFSFPKNILVLEHIDRLVEIFSACWPLYAAMPAILKEAILKSYEEVGWDLDNSYNYKNIFPNFDTLLRMLSQVINESAYSDELKSNYIGSLVTRVKSLTSGLLGNIVNCDGVDDEILFENNSIVDLSRMGSIESKSLIMGILFLKLYEYKIDKEEFIDELKHLTIIEEAHNLLRKNSISSSEGSNIQQKSVEMISNSIAEMRAYGEGFVIIDQSPTSLDDSVIKNTNTKILLRLPDDRDRQIVGKSALLKENQIFEIARLRKGVAAIYQNDWLEPVLCKIDKFNSKNNYKKINRKPKGFNIARKKLIEIILSNKTGKEVYISKEESEMISDYMEVYSINKHVKEKVMKYMLSPDVERKKINFEDILCVDEFIYKTLNGSKIIGDIKRELKDKDEITIEEIHDVLVKKIKVDFEFTNIYTIEIIKNLLVYNVIIGNDVERSILNNWITFMEGRNIY